ncbi:MAG: ABC transporter ATP-binding protein [Actinobacteria bacterium]|jgi:ABC-2 type transport system ATP-binding protein|nr:ABC transporter ATP-binding protein [Actinomycetota bacterium]
MPAAIETRNLTKQWGDLKAVDKLDLVVNEGECYAFLGRNGSGKSTTARMLLDFIRPTGGSSELLGGSGSDPDIRARVGYLPGDLNLPRTMTGRDAFNYFGGLRPSGESDVRDSLVERFGLDPTRPVRELSTGNRRKVGLILAFMNNPELLILDEPTSGLDPVLQEEFRDLLAERKADGATIWLTSHVMAEVARVADRVGLINEGKLVKELTFEELRHQATTEITFGFAEPVPPSAFEDVTSVAAVTQDGVDLVLSLNGPVGAVLKRAAELDAIRVETEQNDLDTIFIQLLSGEEQS